MIVPRDFFGGWSLRASFESCTTSASERPLPEVWVFPPERAGAAGVGTAVQPTSRPAGVGVRSQAGHRGLLRGGGRHGERRDGRDQISASRAARFTASTSLPGRSGRRAGRRRRAPASRPRRRGSPLRRAYIRCRVPGSTWKLSPGAEVEIGLLACPLDLESEGPLQHVDRLFLAIVVLVGERLAPPG